MFGFNAFLNTASAQNISPEREAQLRKELQNIEKEIKDNEAFLNNTKNQSASLSRDLALLSAQIKDAQLKIKAKNINIEQLGKDIRGKVSYIGTLEDRIKKNKQVLASLLYKTSNLQSHSDLEIILNKSSLSDFLILADQYTQVEESVENLSDEIRGDKKQTENEKLVLDKKQNQEIDAKKEIETQQKIIQSKEKEKNQLLALSKGEEKAYEQVLAQKRQKAGEIRAALFTLRDSDAIPFGKAFEYAVAASTRTGVRPAFLLAILQQESSFGKNVGSCYLTDPTTGAGISIKSGNTFAKVMSPTRDVTPFIAITKELGRDPYKTLVSCPLAIGWGGAMGPAQFIPSTWVMFKERVRTVIGGATPDPWRAEDAFAASSIYLSDLGAKNGSYTAEMNAACRYYSGQICGKVTGNTTYGNQVMIRAQNIQDNMINLIQGY